ncbi:zinc finger protein 154-like, partial [Diaphorina citri]|uniref:Zinc finger protein 154-like n=1 Tax=Diaphorina citri TaxID=121845 RepID=A0A3Q0JI58_DIACI
MDSSKTEDSVMTENDVFKADKANLDLQGLEMSPEDRAESEVLGWKCFICDAQLTTETSYSVFYTMLSQSGVLLSNALNKALKTSYVTPHSMRSERACMPLIHECPTCGKKWRTVSELNAHIQTHSDLRPFVCEICGQGYKMKKALLVHVGMHSGIHPFTCHFCNKSFTQKIGLVKHLNIHNGTKKYQCHLCGKGFIHHTSYKFHQLVHSGERNVKCDICGLALTTKSHLNRHMLVHTGDRPHECSVCGKRFAKKWNAQVHKKKVHGLDVPGTTHRVMPVPPIGGGEKEEDVAVMIKQRLMQ